jgi:hypothetical protein
LNRIDNLNRNTYNGSNGYSSNHPNAISDGDDKGKGQLDKNIGSATDIRNRNESVVRNKYGETKRYPDF